MEKQVEIQDAINELRKAIDECRSQNPRMNTVYEHWDNAQSDIELFDVADSPNWDNLVTAIDRILYIASNHHYAPDIRALQSLLELALSEVERNG